MRTEHWQEKDGKLCRSFKFKDFQEAFAFMTRVAFIAEGSGHHPEWTNVYDTLHIALSTHDAGGAITGKDHALAAAINGILG
ncbi:MAG: 4a-hydroxytetrahydrobiopterin dehydratase [Flavobacteriales bacterium]|nr:4a-hydroxytetrahydrobiopterin dehydratase [Flavobacteriales bacterium]